jgi:hypothetical protein
VVHLARWVISQTRTQIRSCQRACTRRGRRARQRGRSHTPQADAEPAAGYHPGRARRAFLGCRGAWAALGQKGSTEALAQARAISADHLPHWLHRATAQPTARPAAPP